MNVNKTPVNNAAANLSMFMVNVSAKLLAPLRLEHAESSVLDLKARYRGLKYLRRNIKKYFRKKRILLLLIKSLNGSVQSVLFIRHPLKSIHHNLAKVLFHECVIIVKPTIKFTLSDVARLGKPRQQCGERDGIARWKCQSIFRFYYKSRVFLVDWRVLGDFPLYPTYGDPSIFYY